MKYHKNKYSDNYSKMEQTALFINTLSIYKKKLPNLPKTRKINIRYALVIYLFFKHKYKKLSIFLFYIFLSYCYNTAKIFYKVLSHY